MAANVPAAPEDDLDGGEELCCLMCCVKAVGISNTVALEILESWQGVDELARLGDEDLSQVLPSLGLQNHEEFRSICRRLAENDVQTIIHRFYSQRKEWLFGVDVEGISSVQGTLVPGAILEIFEVPETASGTQTLLASLRRRFHRLERSDAVYNDVPDRCFEGMLHIHAQQTAMTLSRPTANSSIVEEVFEYGSVHGDGFGEDLENLKRIVLNFQSVSLVIVENVCGDEEEIPCVWRWLDAFQEIFGDIADIAIVFIANVVEYRRFYCNTGEDVFLLVNRNVPVHLRTNISRMELVRRDDRREE